jgi:hypothetical protein
VSVPATPRDGRVALVLMKSEEADATIDVLEHDHPDVRIVDQGPYWYLEHPTEISVDVARVAEEMGKDLTLSGWLVVMATFVGRAAPEETRFRVTSQMPELDEPAAAGSG